MKYGLTNVLKGATGKRQMDSCAPCHSRRAIIHADYRAGDAFLDHFEPSLLYDGLYHADGQILDEVFEYGSFTQSKMYHQGVRCTDCHDPHSLKLKYQGNRLCAQCHQPGKYDGAGHHHHAGAAPGAPETLCVTCHMPEKVYMGIDGRRDHNIRIPRPDLTRTIDSPNVCQRCHAKEGEDAQWAADAIVKWYGSKRPDDPHYAPAIDAARRGAPEAAELIHGVLRRDSTPDIVRATVVELLANYPGPESQRLRIDALKHANPLVRAAAVRSFAAHFSDLDNQIKRLREPARTDSTASIALGQLLRSLAQLVQQVAPKLDDGVRSVRLAAASALASSADEIQKLGFRNALEKAIAEYRAAQSLHLDRAQSNRNLGALDVRLGQEAAAIQSFRTAIRQEPYLTGPRTELAQLLAEVLADPAQRDVVQQVGASEDEVQRLREQEVDLLERDYHLLPQDASPRFQRGRLLYLLGRIDEARQALARACRLAPDNYEYWMWLALICEKQQRWEEAAGALIEMRRLRPEALEWQGIRARMRESMRQQGLLPQAGAADAKSPTAPPPTPASAAATADPTPQPQPPTPAPPGTPGRKAEPEMKD
ncbi:MAG: tetratricopeptide repeat protein [Pirellulales bacterium]|nr:tetratricopeptide repeat protein [Pirellulales bacterium]